MLMLSGVLAFSQSHTVSGSVKDDSGAPVHLQPLLNQALKTLPLQMQMAIL